MIDILKIVVLLLCSLVAIGISFKGTTTFLTCTFLSFFVASGATTFFPKEAAWEAIATAFLVFFTLVVLSGMIAHHSTQKRKSERRRKPL